MQSFGLDRKYFSKGVDCGLNLLKCRGSLAIKPGRTVMRGFWPLDLDLRARNRSARDLIVAVQIESGGSDLLARGAAARVAGGEAPAVAHGRRWPSQCSREPKGLRSGAKEQA